MLYSINGLHKRPDSFFQVSNIHRWSDPQCHNRFQMVLEGCTRLYAPEEISYLMVETEVEGSVLCFVLQTASFTAGAVLLPPRTLISNGARQREHTSKPPCETSFLGKMLRCHSCSGEMNFTPFTWIKQVKIVSWTRWLVFLLFRHAN